MKTVLLWASIVAMLFSFSCSHDGNTPNLDNALPSPELVDLNLPAGDSLFPAAKGIAGTYLMTIDTVNGLNAATFGLLHMVDDIRAQPYTEGEGGAYVWGPYTPPLSLVTHKFTLWEGTTGDISYVFQFQPKADPGAPFQDVLTGSYDPEDDMERSAMQSDGDMVLDFDTARSLDPIILTSGVLTFDYDTTLGNKIINIQLDGFQSDGMDEPINDESYYYSEAPDLSGEFAFTLKRDVAGDTPGVKEDLGLHVRWVTDGNGRADVLATGGDLPNMEPPAERMEIFECWDEFFIQVYTQETTFSSEGDPIAGWTTGDDGLCSFSEADFW